MLALLCVLGGEGGRITALRVRHGPLRRERRAGFDEDKYKRRNVVERCVAWIKEFRRVATRYEKLAASYLAMLKFAMAKRYLGALVDTA